MTTSAAPEIYLGGPIEHRSERDFLAALVEHLTRLGPPAVILANVFLPGRQIDFVVATDHGAGVVEVKGSRFAVQGGLNGQWARRHADGSWRPYRNAYQQALDAKFAVKDALAAWDASLSDYPSAAVVFTPTIPPGSNLTGGDNKAVVSDLTSFLQTLPTSGAPATTLATWRAFAAHLKLELTDLDSASIEDTASVETARAYGAAFTAQYGRVAAAWIAEDDAQAAALIGAAVGPGVHISGPSGCGKSLMAHRLAVDLAARGHPVIFVAGKDVAASWRETVAREIGLLVDDKAVEVLNALKAAHQPLVLVVDGLNEVRGHRIDAIRGVLAMARRYDAMLVVTDQAEPGQAFAGLNAITVPRPSLALKRRIASAGSIPEGPIGKALEAVSSGLEAAIIGMVRAALPAGTTRLQLMERYARERLGGNARAGTRGLRRLAAKLHADIAYSLHEVAFDEFMSAHNVGAGDADAMLTSGLLVRRADRISFGHEMFLAAFAAFDAANYAVEHPAEVGQRLSFARYTRMAGDIVSAIDDAEVVRAVLEATSNVDVLASAAEGELGPLAASAAKALLKEAAETCAQEIEAASLKLNDEGTYPQVDWAEAGLREWSPEETARLQAIGETAAGVNFDLYMGLCARMDAALDLEWRRLLDAARARKIDLRSESFALAYFQFGRSLGFSALRHTRSHASDGRPCRKVAVSDLATFTSGQLHFVLESRYALLADEDVETFAEFLTEAFGHRYRFEPYHVRLSLLTAAGFVRNVSPAAKSRLITAIESLETNQNWALNSSIIDALKLLGALDDEAEAQRDAIEEEIRQALVDPETDDRCSQALSVCVAMFDHPFDYIYDEQITALDEAQGHTLLRRAVSAPETRRSMSLTWIIEKVVDLAEPSDGLRLQRFSALPDHQNLFPQEELGAFILVTRFLGRHRLPLPEVKADTPQAACLSTLRTIIYAWESGDQKLAQTGWSLLGQAEVGVAVRALSDVQRALSDRRTLEDSKTYPRITLSDRYANECLALSRAFLDLGLVGILQEDRVGWGSGAGYALECVAKLGNRSDVARVRPLTHGGPFAQVALEALKILDAT